jgi:hypothetical protein
MKNLLKITIFFILSILVVSCANEGSNVNNNEEVIDETVTDYESEEYDYENESEAYDYIEEYEDFNEKWTIYHSFKPDLDVSDCDSRICDWCSDNYYAESVEYYEHPNTSSRTQMAIIMSNPYNKEVDDNVDYVNKTITTTWESKCIFYSLEYCSKKCEYEANLQY